MGPPSDRPDRHQAVLAVCAGVLGPGSEAEALVDSVLTDGVGVTREELLRAALTRSRAAARRRSERLVWEDEPSAGVLAALDDVDDRAVLALLDGAGCSPAQAARIVGEGEPALLARAAAARETAGVTGRRAREALGTALRGPLPVAERPPRPGLQIAGYVVAAVAAGAAGYALVDRLEASTDPSRPRVVTALPLP